jgi:predicted O-linked N-acetylglucosamine transferase (SPINDLY family)
MGLLDRLLATAQRTLAERAGGESVISSAAQRLLDEGMALEQQGSSDQALEKYDAALRLVPSLARAHFNRGTILLDRGDAVQALQSYAIAIQLKPDSAATFYNMGNAHMQMGALSEAVGAYTSAVKLKADFQDAINALEAAIKLEASDANFHFMRGLAMQDSGQMELAKKSYERALSIQPGHLGACNNLGTLLASGGSWDDAVGLYRKALAIDPANFEVYLNLAAALKSLARPQEAIEYLKQAVELRPGNASAINQLGETLLFVEDFDAAAACFGRAFELETNNANFVFSQGLALQAIKQYQDASQCYRQVIALNPQFAEAYCNLGAIERQLGNNGAAIEYFEQAILKKPAFADAFCNLANAHQALGNLDAAEQNYQKALKLRPDFAVAHCNYGTVFQSRGLLDIAKEKYLQAIRLDPNLHDAYTNLGVVLNNNRQFEDSIESFHRALAIKPDFAPAHVNLGNVLKDIGQVEESLASFRQALSIDPQNLQARSNLLFVLNYLNEQSGQLMLNEAKRFGETVTQMARAYAAWEVGKNPEKPLRIGFVSGDLCGHPVGYFLVGVLHALAQGAADSLTLYAYPTRANSDETSKRIQGFCAGWKSAIGLSDAELARLIHADKIDVLIDLSGHTANSRLSVFAWKPAPIQVSWLGYFATTGVAEMDYFIADPWTLPQSQEEFFAEKIWRLPETRLCFTAPEVDVAITTLPVMANGYITFGCFNNLTKMNDMVVEVWARILHAAPTSKLFLKSQQTGEPTQREKLLKRFSKRGIPDQRLILEDYGPREQYLAAYQRVDIGLDPFPYPGGTTTAEALWMGVPVLTLAGEAFIARQGVGLMMNAGLADWIASDPDDYVQKALAHASNISALSALRARLRQQVLASPVFDAQRFAMHFDEALRTMWRVWCTTDSTHPQPTSDGNHGPV